MKTLNTLLQKSSVLAMAVSLTGFAFSPIASAELTEQLVDEYDGVAFSADYRDRVGNGPALDADITVGQIQGMDLSDVRKIGVRMYTTPFRRADGFGDGPGVAPLDIRDIPDLPSEANGGPAGGTGRPTLQGNGTFLRVNGLDTQTCLECHGVVDNSVVPAKLGVAGQAGIAASPMFRTRDMDPDDSEGNSLPNLGIASFNGRLINPPANFGMGGVELVGQEITQRLQRIQRLANRFRGVRFPLIAKGVYFGSIKVKKNGDVDTSRIEGVDADLVIKPFGRKGEFATVRGFDEGAMAFHIGMQAVDIFGEGDADGDGVENELTTGQMAALHIFLTTTERPFQEKARGQARRGKNIFRRIGCADCHRPVMNTRTPILEYTNPGEDEPFYSVDLSKGLTQFETNRRGGIKVRMFSDFKRHFMGDRLCETAHFLNEEQNCEFITMKLWGVADSGPYLHDGRALTLFEAIALHGGEAQGPRDRFLNLSKGGQNALLSFLGTLRNPENPNQDIQNQVQLDP